MKNYKLELEKKNNFHDYELKDINVNYYSQKISIHIKYSNDDLKLIMSSMKKFTITCLEPWGSGMYISDFKIEPEEKKEKMSELIIIKILLNSGDTISLTCENIVIEVE